MGNCYAFSPSRLGDFQEFCRKARSGRLLTHSPSTSPPAIESFRRVLFAGVSALLLSFFSLSRTRPIPVSPLNSRPADWRERFRCGSTGEAVLRARALFFFLQPPRFHGCLPMVAGSFLFFLVGLCGAAPNGKSAGLYDR